MEPAPVGPATEPVRSRTAFVGRRAEIERLEMIWAGVEDDRRQAAFVGGEPGVGKTRLVVEAAAALREHGATVLWGACREEFNTPYRPFVAIIEQALEQVPPETLREISPRAAAPLLRLTPAAQGRWPSAASLASNDGDSRTILFDAALRVLLAAAEQKPTVLVLEDLHWAPEPTLAMLSHLVESTAGERLLVLATRRTTAPDRTDDVSFALADLHRLDGVSRIDLVGLATEDVAEYLVREAGVSLIAARAAAPVLRDHTGGNPFFLQEYWHDLESRAGSTPYGPGPPRRRRRCRTPSPVDWQALPPPTPGWSSWPPSPAEPSTRACWCRPASSSPTRSSRGSTSHPAPGCWCATATPTAFGSLTRWPARRCSIA